MNDENTFPEVGADNYKDDAKPNKATYMHIHHSSPMMKAIVYNQVEEFSFLLVLFHFPAHLTYQHNGLVLLYLI